MGWVDWRRGGGEAARYRGQTVALRCNAVRLLVAEDGRWGPLGARGAQGAQGAQSCPLR